MSDLIRRDAIAQAVMQLSNEYLAGKTPIAVTILNLAMDRINALPAVTAQAQIDAAREAALQDAISYVRQALIDDAHKHGSITTTRSSAMFTAEIIATNALSRLIPPAIRKGGQP